MFAILNVHPILLYAFQVVACSAIFHLFYKGVIEPGCHFVLCRFYLLFALLAAMVIPLLSIPLLPASLLPHPGYVSFMAAPAAANLSTEATLQAKVGLFPLGISIYLAICGILLVKLGVQLHSLFTFSRSGSILRQDGCLIVHSPKVKTPFSFLNTVYLPIDAETSDENLFLLHERAHVRERHSIDILLCEVASCFFWFNPIFRLMGKELKNVHEYQADRAVARSGEMTARSGEMTAHSGEMTARSGGIAAPTDGIATPTDGIATPTGKIAPIHAYKTLIAKEFLGFSPKIAHAFNQSIIQKRIIMLTQPLKTNRTILRAMLIVPVIAINVMLFSCTAKEGVALETDLSSADPQTKVDLPLTEEVSFMLVETKPSFQGGDENTFTKWVSERIIYPESAKKAGIQGRVMLTFVVDRDGTLRDISSLKPIDPALEAEAIRVISSSPTWTPGYQKGKAAPVRYNFPVIFQLR